MSRLIRTTRGSAHFPATQVSHQISPTLLCQKMPPKLLCRSEASDAVDRALISMTNFANQYNKVAGTTYCSDPSIAAVVIKGLAEHKVSLGAPLCPCRHYDDKQAEADQGYWNCPCVPMRERKECHCMLFLTDDNTFAGDKSSITPEEVAEMISKI
eukprot:CAMPEP_0114507434 /NCGR_PEP_ID=MMETSP0109-20121206/12010_1 /TAXON_ID=29199 /ORGANISM="Chlorarachnion reptans, Strain CCCM449" /LENGTH=155 /DNA_ID=CAMNT_0001686191 /DNA_START=472 /DNA_END=939 /DNA_ORIENTATION=-